MHQIEPLIPLSRIRRAGQFPSRAVDNEGIIVATQKGQAILLNGTGYQIWNWLAETKTLDELTQLISKNAAIDCSQAESDLRLFIEKMHSLGLITWQTNAA